MFIYYVILVYFYFFFFQAEDGIRDGRVTGVQTCALPISNESDPTDGLIEFVRWGPIGRFGLLRMLPKLYDGTHMEHPLAARRAVRRVEFNLPEPIDVMIDGEIATLEIRSLEIVPGAVDVHI